MNVAFIVEHTAWNELFTFSVTNTQLLMLLPDLCPAAPLSHSLVYCVVNILILTWNLSDISDIVRDMVYCSFQILMSLLSLYQEHTICMLLH